MKLKCILTVNNTLIQVKRQPVEHKNIFFFSHTSDMGLESRRRKSI